MYTEAYLYGREGEAWKGEEKERTEKGKEVK